MQLDRATCYRAVASRDRRFEGRFFVAVTTTGIYCRPGCPAPIPKPGHVRFYRVAAAAEEAGFRPCMRCRPDASPESPAWIGTSATVRRALGLLAEGTAEGLEPLASRLGIGARHLRRLFAEHVGASPVAVVQTRRVHFARKLLDETTLSMTEVAYAAGFASVRRFNDAMKQTFRAPPRQLRRALGAPRDTRDKPHLLELRLPFLRPFDWERLAHFLAERAIPGVESVRDARYRRVFAVGGVTGVLEVEPKLGEGCLVLRVETPASRELLGIVVRARHLFDLGADPSIIGAHLRKDPALRPLVAARPGLRVPGAWDPFEVAVRTVLGQQVSVKGATTLAGRLVRAFGEPLAEPTADGLTHVFPRAEVLAQADMRKLTGIGLPSARARALRGLAAAVASGDLAFGGADAADATLRELEGIGPWTAEMIAMRAMREPDAFPAGDLGVRKALGALGIAHATEREKRIETWRPWRAYAAVHLWTWLNEEAAC